MFDGLQKFSTIVQEAEAQVAAQTKAAARIDDLFQTLLHATYQHSCLPASGGRI